MKTIIDILSKGNIELFHSSFLGWLMDRSSNEHGFGDSFLKKLLPKIYQEKDQFNLENDYEVLTEYKEFGCRFDILLRGKNKEKEIIKNRRGLVFENKIKNFGASLQFDAYKKMGYEVVVLAYLPETISSEVKKDYPLITYYDIKDILKEFTLSKNDKYHLFIEDYITYLENNLFIYDSLRSYSNSLIDFKSFRSNISGVIQSMKLSDNDIRTFNYFYYYNLDQFIKSECPELAFGNLSYKEAEATKGNTSWQYEKNMQGIPFMESILHNPFSPEMKFQMHDIFEKLYSEEGFVIAPRIELWLDFKKLYISEDILPESTEAGRLLLGSWSPSLKELYKTQWPYVNSLRRKGVRNDHWEVITFLDVPFIRIVERIKSMLRLIGNFTD